MKLWQITISLLGEKNTRSKSVFIEQIFPKLRPGGILAHGAFLTTHASPTSSSPIHRGVMIRERLLCDHLDPPHEGLDVTPPEFDPSLSTRERFAAHTSDPQCSSCHRLIDPVGFGFENYDGIGRYRDSDGGEVVDSTGTLLMTSGEEYSFNGLGELASLLAHEDQVQSCYAQQWLRFGFGETEGLDTSCYVKTISDLSQQNGTELRSALLALTTTSHFTTRLGEAQELDAIDRLCASSQWSFAGFSCGRLTYS